MGLLYVAGTLGVSTTIATQVVDIINNGATAITIISIFGAILSGGALALTVDSLIAIVKNKITKEGLAKAITW
ncbi:MAG: uberolysin/carnocyclin family circular bacteriocin [Candidatus Ancillula sp.]|jgi:circularin A/uberolysin family circular bacteriocin|nr:uberolysin/carnocyclin family circular bacteriocin [Candidatus Ancillula sp.]